MSILLPNLVEALDQPRQNVSNSCIGRHAVLLGKSDDTQDIQTDGAAAHIQGVRAGRYQEPTVRYHA